MQLRRVTDALRMSGPRQLVLELAVMLLGLTIGILFALALIEDEPTFIEPKGLTETILLLAPMLLALLGRRRWPLSVLAIVMTLFTLIRVRLVPELQISSVAIVIAFYCAGRYGAPKWRDILRAVGALVICGIIVHEVAISWDIVEQGIITRRVFLFSMIGSVLSNIALFGVTWWAGDLGRRRAERDQELAARTIELEASREENARRAVMDERVRIAREIHDVVAHHVSVMGLHAGVARTVAASDHPELEEPLRAIENSSRDAVTELHRLLGFLRRVDEIDPDGLTPEALRPAPGLHRLPELREQLAAAGLALRIVVTGAERPLPPAVDLNAYRILQEALTNCLKYAGVDTADLELHYTPDALVVSVVDRGRGGTTTGTPSTGSGLLGMAERVALVGGSLEHGPRPEGGFAVRAVLPYEGISSAAPAALSTAAHSPRATP